VLRTHSEDELNLLRRDGIGMVFYGEEELAKGIVGHVLRRYAPQSGSSAQERGGGPGSP
jgi:CPA2 family monovalent cation:H+ antiporter-2